MPKLSPSRKLNISPNESGIKPAITVVCWKPSSGNIGTISSGGVVNSCADKLLNRPTPPKT